VAGAHFGAQILQIVLVINMICLQISVVHTNCLFSTFILEYFNKLF